MVTPANGSTYVGIDLGTTNSCACISDGTKAHVVRSAQGGNLTPSVVRIDARGNALVGQRARKFLESDPNNTRAEFKRLMGTENTLSFAAANLTKRPEDLAAIVLSSLRADLTQALGYAPTQAVITVPALFELPQSRATADAARMAGFERVELLQEPVASALAAGWAGSKAGAWLVYDLGGGTFDVSLLEPQEGLLRVVGHDGDNFLGGRDIDTKMMEFVLGELQASEGITIDRKDPSVGAALRRLRLACEEAKLDAGQGKEAIVTAPQLVLLPGRDPIDVDVVIPGSVFERIVMEIVDPSIAVCHRLLVQHGMTPEQIDRIVLVGGPTVMPMLRERIASTLGVRVDEGLDPMTLVAEGAALFAATSGLTAAKAGESAVADAPPTDAVQAWFQYPTVTGDLGPYVVGKIVAEKERARIREVVFRRRRDGWESKPEAIDADGTFAAVVSLDERATTEFDGFGTLTNGDRLPLVPAPISIRHGITIGDPPLSRSIGIAREDGHVHVYFERGAPLPTRRSYTLQTATALGPSIPGSKLRIPIVQGEFPFADLCRLVGAIEIDGAALGRAVAPGTKAEVVLSLDRGGALHGSARLEGIEQVFDQVALLVTPALSPDQLRQHADRTRERLAELHAFCTDNTLRAKLGALDVSLDDVMSNADLGEGGDADAIEKARRRLLEVDGDLHEISAARAWPELEEECEDAAHTALIWVGRLGSDTEKASLERAIASLGGALHARDASSVRRQLRFVREIADVCASRDPQAWTSTLEHLASRVHEAFDLRAAQTAVESGRVAAKAGNDAGVRQAVGALNRLLPAEAKERKRNLGSGVR